MDYYEKRILEISEKRILEISEMTNTPTKRENLNELSDSEKLAVLYELTDSKDFTDLLEFIQSSYNDSDYCNSYR